MALRNQEIGARLRELRGQKPQTTVADELGVAERTYQNWEAGDAKPAYRNLQRIAEYYGTTEEYILTGAGDVADHGPLGVRHVDTPDLLRSSDDDLAGQLAEIKAALAVGQQERDAILHHLNAQNQLLERQSRILDRIEQAIELEDEAAKRLADDGEEWADRVLALLEANRGESRTPGQERRRPGQPDRRGQRATP